MFFLEGEENWMNDVNEWFFSGEADPVTLPLALSKIVELSGAFYLSIHSIFFEE